MQKRFAIDSMLAVADHKNLSRAAWGAMLAGTALSIYGWTRKSASGAALGVAGGAIALRAASAGPIADLIGTETTATCSVTVMRNAADLYEFWSDVEKAPRWMEFDSVARLNASSTRWVRSHPEMGTLISMIEITEDLPGRSIAWRSFADRGHSDLNGRVDFLELGKNRGTRVSLTLRYKMHGGLLHTAGVVAGEHPEREMRENLRRFKMLMESGEIATIEGQSHGPRKSKGKLMEALLREVEEEAA